MIFSAGFRPFFLLAIAYAALAIIMWIPVFMGHMDLSGPFLPIDWHIHEMLYGYTAAVVCGFLFTAIPNWTGRLPIRGWLLASLVVLWLAGRVVIGGLVLVDVVTAAVIDSAFLVLVAVLAFREVIAGKNWRNLIVAIPISVYAAGNILFHYEVMEEGSSDVAQRLGMAVVVFLIMLIGGRIIPLFTKNWLVKFNPGTLPVTFARYDVVCLVVAAVAFVLWSFAPDNAAVPWGFFSASALHAVRMARWQGLRVISSPIMIILHIAYVFVPAGVLLLGLGEQAAGMHMLGVGAIGGMTMAVMIRATLGHTGRTLEIGFCLTIAFLLLVMAAMVRSFIAYEDFGGASGIEIAAALWSVSFLIVLVRVGPWFFASRVDGK